MSAQLSRSSWASRDLPIPGSPTSSTSVPKPMRTGATEAPRTARSRSRSKNGSSSRTSAARGSLGRRQEIAQHEGLHGLGLALERQWLELRGRERSTAARERSGRNPDLVLSGASHQPRRERRGVAEHGVRPAEARTHLAREDASLAHADVNREREARVDDGANRSQHPLLVVAEGLRRARNEDDPPAVAIDIAFEEGHLVLVRGRLNGAHESVERVRSRLGSLGLDDLVRAGEADEGDRRVSVLSLERPDLEQLCA